MNRIKIETSLWYGARDYYYYYYSSDIYGSTNIETKFIDFGAIMDTDTYIHINGLSWQSWQ